MRISDWSSDVCSSDLVHPAPRAPRASDAAERPAVAHEQVEQRHRVGRRPFALLPRAIPADRARQCQPHQPRPVMTLHDGNRPLATPAANTTAALGHIPLDPPPPHPASASVAPAAEPPHRAPPPPPPPSPPR